MEDDLLRYLLAAFPKNVSPSPPDTLGDDEYLLIHGYRAPFESPVDDIMLSVLADFRRRGFGGERRVSDDRG